ncbi:hypothetical protein MRS_185 [Staphylococcus phage MR003]|nr:hypothetical protein MRS_185 [Staphylococcus phage MR003]
MEYWKEQDIYYSKTKQGVISYIDLSSLPKKKSRIDWVNVNHYIPFKYHSTKGKLYIKYLTPTKKESRVEITYNNKTQATQVANVYKVKFNFITQGQKSYTVHNIKQGDIIKNCEVLKVVDTHLGTQLYVYNIKEEVYGKVSKQNLLKYKTDNYIPYGTIPQSKMLYHKKHIHKYVKYKDLFKYKYTTKKKIETICPNCKRKKDIRITDLIKDNYSCQCSKQYSSFGERLTQSYLDIANIEYIREYKFKELGKKRFDFFLPKYNTVIEVHGVQHYQEVSGYMNHQKTKLSDIEKREYCKENSIQYIEIDARKSTFKHILSNLQRTFKYSNIDSKEVIKRYRHVYR